MSTLRAIHAGCRALGYDEDMRRNLYRAVTGESSAADMSEAQRSAVVAELRRRGFETASNGSRKPLDGPYAKKLQALWIAGWNLGLIRDRDDRALLAFVRRQTGIGHTRFLHRAADGAKAIEALKAWLTRDGGVDWKQTARFDPPYGFRVAEAQVEKLHGDASYFWTVACKLGGKREPAEFRHNSDWIPVMNALGAQIRQAAVARGAAR